MKGLRVVGLYHHFKSEDEIKMLIEYKCNNCDSTVANVEISSGMHKKVTCQKCSRFIKFIGWDELQKCKEINKADGENDENKDDRAQVIINEIKDLLGDLEKCINQ